MTMESFEELWFSDLKAQQENAEHPAAPEAERAEIQLTIKRDIADTKPKAPADKAKETPADEQGQSPQPSPAAE